MITDETAELFLVNPMTPSVAERTVSLANMKIHGYAAQPELLINTIHLDKHGAAKDAVFTLEQTQW